MRVFVSCPYRMQDARRVALDSIEKAGHKPVEIYADKPQSLWLESNIENTIKSCEVFISIHGHTYGTVTRWNDQSYSEWEYLLARTLNMPVLLFLLADEQAHMRRSKLRRDDPEIKWERRFWHFREALCSKHLCVFWKELSKLRFSIIEALAHIEMPKPKLSGRIELINITTELLKHLSMNPADLCKLSPVSFENLIHDRLLKMGFSVERTGQTNRKDGGIDLVFWPEHVALPFLGAAQIKHHGKNDLTTGAPVVRDFAGVLKVHPFNMGLIVTNTKFTPDANWFAKHLKTILRLRDVDDIRRWLIGQFASEQEFRDLPSEIEICPGIAVPIGLKERLHSPSK